MATKKNEKQKPVLPNPMPQKSENKPKRAKILIRNLKK